MTTIPEPSHRRLVRQLRELLKPKRKDTTKREPRESPNETRRPVVITGRRLKGHRPKKRGNEWRKKRSDAGRAE